MTRCVTEFHLVDHIHWALINGSIETKIDCVWVLQNIACDETGKKYLTENYCETCSLVLLEMSSNNTKMKRECMLFFANLLSELD